jgi:hypothetical protein
MNGKIVEVGDSGLHRASAVEPSRKHPFLVFHVGWCVSVGGHAECIEAADGNQVIRGGQQMRQTL